jgi:hypothetical protein
MGIDDFLSASGAGLSIFGGSGTDVVSVNTGASSLVLDQAIDRINLPAALSTYTFKQTGNQINVYDSTGSTLILNVPLQGDADGTLLSFSNGMASTRIQAGGVMRLADAVVSSANPTALTATLSANTPTTQTTTKAKAFLGANDTLTVSTSGLSVFGSSGLDVVTIGAGVSSVVLDQAVDSVKLSASASSYTFKQTGNQINVFDSTGTVQIVNVPLQGDADGTVLSFSGISFSATIQAGGVMKLGGLVVSATSPTALALGTGISTPITTAGSSDASAGEVTFNVALGNYTHTIANFAAGDKIVGPAGLIPTVSNSSFTDGNVNITYASAGQTAVIMLTGLTVAQDGSIFSAADVNTLFGAGSLL